MDNNLGYSAAGAAGAAGPWLQRKLRKMSVNPRDPRVFSQAKILVPFGLISSLASLLCLAAAYSNYREGHEKIDAIIGVSTLLFVCLLFLSHGFWRRFGVDEEKIWTKFGKLFYREIRFDELTRLNIGVQRYKLYTGRRLVNLDYNRFDYSLAYIRMLEELTRRRFDLPEAKTNDPNYEKECHEWKGVFLQKLQAAHGKFYNQHPEELTKLQKLVNAPIPPLQ